MVGAEERSGDLVGFGASDGDERWRIEPVESGERIVWLAPLGDDAVLVQYRPRDDEDTVARLAAVSTDGDVRWRYFRREMGFTTPVGEDGDVAVLSSERSGRGAFDLTLLARSDGDVRWSHLRLPHGLRGRDRVPGCATTGSWLSTWRTGTSGGTGRWTGPAASAGAGSRSETRS